MLEEARKVEAANKAEVTEGSVAQSRGWHVTWVADRRHNGPRRGVQLRALGHARRRDHLQQE